MKSTTIEYPSDTVVLAVFCDGKCVGSSTMPISSLSPKMLNESLEHIKKVTEMGICVEKEPGNWVRALTGESVPGPEIE